jgi:hypothetical protein
MGGYIGGVMVLYRSLFLRSMEEVKPGRYRHIKGGLYDVLGVAVHRKSLDSCFDFVGIATYTENPDRQFMVYQQPGSKRGEGMLYQDKVSSDRAVEQAYHSEELGDLVIYWSLDEAGANKQLWARSKKMFTENVRKEGGVEVPRFRYVGDSG